MAGTSLSAGTSALLELFSGEGSAGFFDGRGSALYPDEAVVRAIGPECGDAVFGDTDYWEQARLKPDWPGFG